MHCKFHCPSWHTDRSSNRFPGTFPGGLIRASSDLPLLPCSRPIGALPKIRVDICYSAHENRWATGGQSSLVDRGTPQLYARKWFCFCFSFQMPVTHAGLAAASRHMTLSSTKNLAMISSIGILDEANLDLAEVSNGKFACPRSAMLLKALNAWIQRTLSVTLGNICR